MREYFELEEDKWAKNTQKHLDLRELIQIEHDRLHLEMHDFIKSAEARFKEIQGEKLPALEHFHELHANNLTPF